MSEVVSSTGLSQGSLIGVRVKAINTLGYSLQSDLNTSGATVKVQPQAPTVAPTRNSLTSNSQLVVDFGPLDSSMNGGSDITSYALQVLSSGSWVEAIGISTPNLLNTVTLTSPDFTVTSGERYTFRWAAVNIFGTSAYSPTAQILAASVPAQPNPVTLSVLTNGDLQISWTDPTDTGGSGVLITDHVIVIVTKASTYVEEPSLCDGSLDTASADFS